MVQVLSHGYEVDNMEESSVGKRLTSWRCQHQIGELSFLKKAGIKKMLPGKRNEDLNLNSMPFFYQGLFWLELDS